MKYHDPNTSASDPGRVALSDRRLRRFHPELYADDVWRVALQRYPHYRGHSDRNEWRERLAEHLECGDSRAALVVSTDPFLIAAYTDELDCIAVLEFDRKYREPHWSAGTRLLTVNTYFAEWPAPDLTQGPDNMGNWTNFWPLIADLLTEDTHGVAQRKAAIEEKEWSRIADLVAERSKGFLRFFRRSARPRDGRPLLACLPRS